MLKIDSAPSRIVMQLSHIWQFRKKRPWVFRFNFSSSTIFHQQKQMIRIQNSRKTKVQFNVSG